MSVWANQWEPSTKVQHAAQVYVTKWGLEQTDDPDVYMSGDDDVFVNKDISDIDADSIPDHDLICGGSPARTTRWPRPCPPLMVCGQEGGALVGDTQDNRGQEAQVRTALRTSTGCSSRPGARGAGTSR